MRVFFLHEAAPTSAPLVLCVQHSSLLSAASVACRAVFAEHSAADGDRDLRGLPV